MLFIAHPTPEHWACKDYSHQGGVCPIRYAHGKIKEVIQFASNVK